MEFSPVFSDETRAVKDLKQKDYLIICMHMKLYHQVCRRGKQNCHFLLMWNYVGIAICLLF